MSDVVDPVVGKIGSGDQIGTFVVEKKLGEGGMGAVFLARDPVTKYPVAIKMLFGTAAHSAEMNVRFRNEASASNMIGHQAFVRCISFGTHSERPYLVMEFLVGKSLGELLKASESQGALMPNPRACAILIQICEALQAAHDHGVVHRDMKPDNVYLLAGDAVKILDLGIAKFVHDTGGTKTRTGLAMGTPHTMSPEQCRDTASVDHRSDIYSVGVVAYRMVSGRWPFEGSFNEIVASHLVHAPPRLRSVAPWVPEEFADVVERAMEKDPGARFQHIAEMAQALRPIADVTVPLPANMPTVQPQPKPITTQSAASGQVQRTANPPTQGAAPTSWTTLGAFAVALAIAVGGGTYFIARKPASVNTEAATPPSPPAATQPTKPAERVGRAHISTAPPGASVYVDGKLLGSAPVDITGPADQSRKIRVSSDGFNDREEDVLLTEQGAKIDLTLVKTAQPPTTPPPAASPPPSKPKTHKNTRTDRPADPFNE